MRKRFINVQEHQDGEGAFIRWQKSPNSADVTMGEFVDDLTVNLDRAYARYRLQDFEVVGGKCDHSYVGDWSFDYGYGVAEADAVLTSQDNTTYPTNYREHTVSASYLVLDDMLVNLTGYLYRRDAFAFAGQPGDNNWVSRFRPALQFRFDEWIRARDSVDDR